jgi:hypothetical protein
VLDANRVAPQFRHCYHHIRGPRHQADASQWLLGWKIEVRPESIGRVLGVGVRVAGRLAGQAIMGEGQQADSISAGNRPVASPANAADRGRIAGQTTRGVARGLSGFFKPFRSVGGKIWLEVTGVFFLLPVLVFSPVLWRTRASWQQGPDHRTFVASAVLVVVFLYLGVSSFWRAGRRRS